VGTHDEEMATTDRFPTETDGLAHAGRPRTGETVDILLDATNPGLWMAYCHIAEHHESGMMFSFRVDDRA
jgi:FtsP/CotA-like multicopper oxidase with cupredoxin domain